MEKKVTSGHNRHESPVQLHIMTGRKTRLNYGGESNLDLRVAEHSESPKRRRKHLGLSNRKSEQLKATTNKTPDMNNSKRSKRLSVTSFKSYNINDKVAKDLNGTSTLANTSTNETRVNSLGRKNNVTSKSMSSQEILGESDLDISTVQKHLNVSKKNDSIHRKIARGKKNKARNTFSVGIKPIVRKMSKSPKIVLKLSKSKSKLTLRMKKARSPNEKFIGNKSLPSLYTKDKAELVKRSCISRRRKSDSDGMKVEKSAPDILSLKKLSSMKNKFLLKEAVVELHKLPDDISTISALAFSCTPTSNEKRHVSNKSPREPLMSSTPRNEKHRQCKMERKLRDSSEWRKKGVESKGMCDPLDTQKENGMEIDEREGDTRGKNDTYELKEPKTPNLRRKLERKESSNGGSSTKKKTPKKNVMVRFTSPSTDTNKSYNTRLRTSVTGKDDEDDSKVAEEAITKKEILKTPISGFRKRSESGSGANTSPVRSFPRFSPVNRRKSSSIISLNVTSTSRLGSSRKTPDAKNSATKKAPNFPKIHRKMFAKSESVVDAKKRLEERHIALTGTKPPVHSRKTKTDTKEESQLANGSQNGRNNRFGFRIRKNDATEYILKKTNVHSTRNKQLQQNRAILKGVRINRRFELQMKARNMN